MSENNNIIFFDFDFTITNVDSFFNVFPAIKDKEVLKKLETYYKNLDWNELFEATFDELKRLGYTLSQIRKTISETELSPGMANLLNYLKANKNTYDPYVLTSNVDIIINNYLKDKNLEGVFCDIIGVNSVEDKENDIIKIVELGENKVDCDLCKKNLCKQYEAKTLIEKRKDRNYKKVMFVCDGKNDYCLARYLKENDVLFVRKNYALYKKLYEEDFIKNLKCEVVPWESADEIKNYLENMK